MQDIPTVLTLAGHDPCGAAGIQADIETIASLGCQAVSLVTATTAQNTATVQDFRPTPADWLLEQARCLLSDLTPRSCKIGLLVDEATVDVVAAILATLPGLPVVLDPVITSGSGTTFAGTSVNDALLRKLLPHTLVLTPNSNEARWLTGLDSLDAAATRLITMGCHYVLVTGTHEATDKVVNRLYGTRGFIKDYQWPRLEGEYHGSGCTLSAAIAALLARGMDCPAAVGDAQAYVWQALRHGAQLGRGQRHPNRFFWGRYTPEDS